MAKNIVPLLLEECIFQGLAGRDVEVGRRLVEQERLAPARHEHGHAANGPSDRR